MSVIGFVTVDHAVPKRNVPIEYDSVVLVVSAKSPSSVMKPQTLWHAMNRVRSIVRSVRLNRKNRHSRRKRKPKSNELASWKWNPMTNRTKRNENDIVDSYTQQETNDKFVNMNSVNSKF